MKGYAICGRLVDVEAGRVITNGLVLTEGNRIVYAGEAEGAPPADGYEAVTLAGGTILPGFIDCHAHLCGISKNYLNTPLEYIAIKAASDCGDLLDAGFTTARDMTKISPSLKRAIEDGWCRGPRIMAGSQVLSVTGGHGDMDTTYPVEFADDNLMGKLCDGKEECLKVVRQQFRRGAEFIKVCATGGVSSMSDGLDDVQFSTEELQAIVDEAARKGTYVAAHCSSLAGAKQALKCGVKTIEHGIVLDDECVELMVKNDCSLVTTLYVSLNVGNMAMLPEWLRAKGRLCAERNKVSIAKAHAAGVNIALGTDFGNKQQGAGSTDFSFIGKEFEAITQCGFTNMEALQIGTINGAKCMRKEAEIGSLKAGKLADVVICQGNPTQDITVLGDCANIRFVMKDGKVEKNTIGG